jgi:hypothetical protein
MRGSLSKSSAQMNRLWELLQARYDSGKLSFQDIRMISLTNLNWYHAFLYRPLVFVKVDLYDIGFFDNGEFNVLCNCAEYIQGPRTEWMPLREIRCTGKFETEDIEDGKVR